MSDIKPPAQPQRTQSAEEFLNTWMDDQAANSNGWADKPWYNLDLVNFAEAYAQSLKQAAAPAEPVADPSKEELVIEIARELYDRFVMGGWEPQDAYPQIREWLRDSPSKEELKAALGQARDYVVGLSAYLATCATATIIENLETTITSLHKERDYLERLLSGDGKE